MGTFYTECTIENHVNRKKTTHIPKILVNTGSEYSKKLGFVPQPNLLG